MCNLQTSRLSCGLEHFALIQQYAQNTWRLAEAEKERERLEKAVRDSLEGEQQTTMNPEPQEMGGGWEEVLRVMDSLIKTKRELVVEKEKLRDKVHNLYRAIRSLRLGPNSLSSTSFNDRFHADQMTEPAQIMEILESSPQCLYYYVRFAASDSSDQECFWCPSEWVTDHAPQLVSNFHKSFPWKDGPRVVSPEGVIYTNIPQERRMKYATQ